jgi:hypothetical protein
MKSQIPQLEKAVTTARQQLLSAQSLAAKIQTDAKSAKAKSRQLKLEHKRARAAARNAKRLAITAQERVRKTEKLLAKATRRLEKALKKRGKKAPVKQSRAHSVVARAGSDVRQKRPLMEHKPALSQPIPLVPPKPLPPRISPGESARPAAGA